MKRRLVALGLMALAPFVAPAAARADVLDDAWKRGHEAYFRGDHAAAATAYEQLDQQGVVSADLAYNLGVAYFRQGKLGRAIWAFERAAALDPADDDVRFNLAQARKVAERRTRDKIEGAEREPTWIRVVTFALASTETVLFLALYLGCFVMVFLRRRADDESRPALGAGAAILAVGAALTGLLLLGRLALDRIPFGIVLPDALAVKEGADSNYRTTFDLHAGLKVRVQQHDQGWVRIRLPNGLEGWVRDGDIGLL